MKKKMLKALRDLNAYIDDDRQKLCDRIHDLELSHKRLESLVRSFVKCAYTEEVDDDYFHWLVKRAEKELSYPYFRVNYRIKGGKNV